MEMLSLILGVIGGCLGAFSIFVTWKLYQASNEVHLKVLELLSEINASSHTAEVTSTRYTDRLVGALVEYLQRDMPSNLAVAQRDVTNRIKAVIGKHLQGIDQNVANAVSAKVLNDIRDTFKTLTLEAAGAAQLAESPGAVLESPASHEAHHPGTIRVVRWMSRNEGKYPFFSIRFMRERIFRADGTAKDGLQLCIDRGLVELYEVPNPNNAQHPVTACRLRHDRRQLLLPANLIVVDHRQDHPAVRQILA